MNSKADYILPDWPAPPNVQAFFTTRRNSPPGPAAVVSDPQQSMMERRQWLAS